MDVIQECAKNFQHLIDTTTYTLHTSLKKKITVLNINFKLEDFHHAIGLQYLTDISIPRNKKNVISWVLNEEKPVTDDYLEQSSSYKGKNNEERDVQLRISEFRYLEEYLDADNIVYIYSPVNSPQNNSLIKCDYIIKSFIKSRNQTVFIFLKHRAGADSPCGIVSFAVKKNVEYGGLYQYIMLKDKTVNQIRQNIFIHPKYTREQILLAEPDANINYI